MLALGAVDVPWWAMTSNDDREFSVRLSAEALRAHPVEAEVLLRLGSIANALIAMGRRFPDLPYSTRKDERDAFQLMMVVAGHVWTAINELQKLHGEMWWTLAEKGVHHRDMPAYMSLPRLREVLDRDSTFAQACKRIRNKYAFHNDPAPYVSFVESARGEIRLIELKGGKTLGDVLFPASQHAVMAAIPEMNTPEFTETLTNVMAAFPYVVEAFLIGFVDNAGLLFPGQVDGNGGTTNG